MRELVLQRAPLPWEVLHVFLVRELKLVIPFLGVLIGSSFLTDSRQSQSSLVFEFEL